MRMLSTLDLPRLLPLPRLPVTPANATAGRDSHALLILSGRKAESGLFVENMRLLSVSVWWALRNPDASRSETVTL